MDSKSVDWSQFRDGDRVRVVLEGDWRGGGLDMPESWLSTAGTLGAATSAELIERPFTPPAAGKLFRKHSILCISLGDLGYRTVRDDTGPVSLEFSWRGADPHWLASIEVLDL